MLSEPKQPRLAPLEPPFDREVSEILQRLGPPIALFRVFARRPALARGVAAWGGYYFSRESALRPRLRELVIHRTTASCGADYEWGVHVAYLADKVGFSSEQLRSLAGGMPSDPCWIDPSECAVLRAVDELYHTHDLSDETWTQLVDTCGEDAALELLLLCGWYHAISFVVKAVRLPLEPGTRPIGAS